LVRPIRAIAYTPSTPTNVTASADSTTAATLRFTQPPSPLSGAIRYAVTSTPAASVTTSTNSDGSLAVSGLASATSYTFTVTAVGAYGRGEMSQRTAAVITKPLPPSNIRVLALEPRVVLISCDYPSAGAGVNMTIEMVSGTDGLTMQRTLGQCNFGLTGIQPGGRYNFVLVSKIGNLVSDPVTVQFSSAPAAPSNLRGTADVMGGLRLTFIAPPSNGAEIFYELQQSGPTWIGSYSQMGQTITINGLQRRGTYRFALRAYVLSQSRAVYSPYSPEIVVTVP
jgi:hypothetical protein